MELLGWRRIAGRLRPRNSDWGFKQGAVEAGLQPKKRELSNQHTGDGQAKKKKKKKMVQNRRRVNLGVGFFPLRWVCQKGSHRKRLTFQIQ